ncbi:MAG TPA: asparaginase [Candidatus Acidoferrales bacterium]|nr:asparaginase [Candidatus Acidoferrales bacterium]
MSGFEPFECGTRAAVLVTRGELVESEHYVCFAIVDLAGRILASNGDIERRVYMRSSAKPMIATAMVASGAADRFGFTDREIAIAAGSHSGEPKHVSAVSDMLAKIGLEESALQCGVHAPTHGPSADALCLAGEMPRAIHNNCSGKHAGILALAVALGASPEGYLSADHPAQREILRVCARLLDVPQNALGIGVDGCGIPVIAVGLRIAAAFYGRLGSLEGIPNDLAPALKRVRDAMLAHPEYVAGTNRFDTDLMTAARPRVLAKGGAEGYHGSSALDRGIGMTVKVADGNYRAVAPFVIDRLASLGVLDEGMLRALEPHRVPKIKNHAGKVVGEILLAAPTAR